MRTIITLHALFFFSCLFISCEKTVPEPIEVVSVEQDFEVFPSQKITAEGTQVFLTVRGKEPDSCINAILDANLNFIDDKINLELNGISAPEFCEEGSAFIQKDFHLPSNPASYTIEFTKDGLISTAGTLIITEDALTLDIENLGGVFVLESRLALITDKHVWGFFIGRDGAATNNNFNLEEAVSEFDFYTEQFNRPEPGQYDYFSVAQDGTVSIPDLKESAIAYALELENDESWEKVKSSLDKVAEFRNELMFVFMKGSGEVYQN